jgi:hypothetical protein
LEEARGPSQDKLHDDDYADKDDDDVYDDTCALCANEKLGLRVAVNRELGEYIKGRRNNRRMKKVA